MAATIVLRGCIFVNVHKDFHIQQNCMYDWLISLSAHEVRFIPSY